VANTQTENRRPRGSRNSLGWFDTDRHDHELEEEKGEASDDPGPREPRHERDHRDREPWQRGAVWASGECDAGAERDLCDEPAAGRPELRPPPAL
jgi:hypothetical protein